MDQSSFEFRSLDVFGKIQWISVGSWKSEPLHFHPHRDCTSPVSHAWHKSQHVSFWLKLEESNPKVDASQRFSKTAPGPTQSLSSADPQHKSCLVSWSDSKTRCCGTTPGRFQRNVAESWISYQVSPEA